MMKPFSIDSQTFRDLNIFTDHSTGIFALFKNTRTMGGREMLRKMMEHPIADHAALTARRDAIAYFFDHKIEMDISNSEMDLIAFYLNFDKRKSKNNPIDSVGDFLTRNSGNDYYIVTIGIKYIIKLVKYLSAFIESRPKAALPIHLATIFDRIAALMGEGKLSEAIKLNKGKLNFFEVNKFDHAFRGVEKENLKVLLDCVYELDVFENTAQVASKLGLSFPVYDPADDLDLTIAGLFHPSISKPVHNDVHIAQSKNVVFLTGANMAGKSSVLKSLGLAIYLAHIGFPVPAKQMKTTIFDGLITTINLPDDINQGFSHYYSEVRRVKEVALKLAEHQRMFIIFDELFRGTNVIDAFDASLLIVSALCEIKKAVFLISTHIVELAEELKAFENITFKHMETIFENEKPIFTYQLREGVATERLGMFIVLNEGIVAAIQQAARLESGV
jgi:DNA mismatch repair protein MutS